MNMNLLTTKEVAEYLHCSTHHVTHLRKAGFILGTRYGKYWLYSDETINKFVQKSQGFDLSNFGDLSEEGLRREYGNLLQK